jgi:hypothetical protein
VVLAVPVADTHSDCSRLLLREHYREPCSCWTLRLLLLLLLLSQNTCSTHLLSSASAVLTAAQIIRYGSLAATPKSYGVVLQAAAVHDVVQGPA